jgi:hypothetical protein
VPADYDPAMPPGDAGFRFILATRRLDRVYRRLDRLRSTAILALVSDAGLDRFNAWAYQRATAYRPGREEFRSELFPWEQQALERHFPAPPARILVGGAGGGRESLVLARRGYDVLAFEPALELAHAMAAAAADEQLPVAAYQGGYSDLERLVEVPEGAVRAAAALGPFDGVIAGWGSFTHVRSHGERVATLRALAGLTSGPLLVSFIATRADGEDENAGALVRRLLARHGRRPEDRFSMFMGFQHPVSPSEVGQLAGAAELEVLELDFGGAALAPYAVLRHVPDRGRKG